MQKEIWRIGNQGVVAVLMVVGVITVGAIGWLFIDKKVSSSSWINEKVILEKSLMLAQAEKANLMQELSELKDRVQSRLEASQLNTSKIEAENKLLGEEKQALLRELDLVKDKMKFLESNTFFADLIKEKAELEVALGGIKNAVNEKEKELALLKDKNLQMLAQLEGSGRGETVLQSKIQEKEKVNQLLAQDLAKEKKEAKSLRAQFDLMNVEKDRLARQLDQLVSEKELAQRKVNEVNLTLESSLKEKEALQAKLDGVYDVINDRLGEIVRVKKALELTLDETKQLVEKQVDEIELEPIVVRGTPARGDTQLAKAAAPAEETRDEEEARMMKAVQAASLNTGSAPEARAEVKTEANRAKELVGRVLVVNEKLNFIVVNLGANQGVQIGMKLAVLNNNHNVIADTQVIEVRDNIAAADIQNLATEGSIKEGDYVRIPVGG